MDALTKIAAWSREHRNELAALLSAGTGVTGSIVIAGNPAHTIEVLPMNRRFAASQQQEADRFHTLGLIPTAINVRTQVWHLGA